MGDVSLDRDHRPLCFLLGGLLQRHHMGSARVHILHVALDSAAFAGGVMTFEQDNDALAGLMHPILRLQQLPLKFQHMLLVQTSRHVGLVGVFT